jgi:mono/diheme cytochrome c family protein
MTVKQSGRTRPVSLCAAVAMWLAWPIYAESPPPASGRVVYDKWCAPCHDPGIDHPGTHALMAKYQGTKPPVLLERTDLPASIVRYFVRHGISVMPQFRKTEISDAELDALSAYVSRSTK